MYLLCDLPLNGSLIVLPHPREEAEEKAHAAKSWKDMDFAEKLDNFAPLAIIPALIVVAYMVWYFWTKRTLNFGLNEVVLMFFAAGALCHKTPAGAGPPL